MSRCFNFKKRVKLNRLKLLKVKYNQWIIQIIVGKPIAEKHIIDIKHYLEKKIKEETNINICFVPNSAVTKKLSETRMGGGKSVVERYQYYPRPGAVLVELYNISIEDVYMLVNVIKNKLPCKVKLFRLNE